MRIADSGQWPVHVFVDSTISSFVKSCKLAASRSPWRNIGAGIPNPNMKMCKNKSAFTRFSGAPRFKSPSVKMGSKRRFKQHNSTIRYGIKRATRKMPVSGKRHAFAKPPEGYVFVPKGDVYITRKCTTLTQESGQEVHIVYVSSLQIKFFPGG